jgi:ATP-dependent DNA helicase DinG
MLSQLVAFREPPPLGSVRWVDLGHWARLMQAPLDIAETVRTRMLAAPAAEASPQDTQDPDAADAAPWRDAPARPRSWIFTSATLGDDATLRWFTEPCGLSDARVLKVQSPFNYAKQAVLFVPRELVRPNDPQHTPQVAALAEKIVRALGGRTLVLTTTLRALRQIGETLRQQLADASGLEVLVQGEGSKRELMERFRAGDADSQRGCVLVASATFWEGFDVPGEALQAVIIDKLPFPPPNDPMVEARGKRLEAQGRSPFNHYFLPEAVVALKQGAGRLIRRETDKGVLVVCDNRLITTGYGRRLMDALPPMARASSEPALLEGLRRLTKASTTDPTS